MAHVHDFSGPLYACQCGRTAENEARGELTHPGTPTSERLWDLMFRLVRSGQKAKATE